MSHATSPSSVRTPSRTSSRGRRRGAAALTALLASLALAGCSATEPGPSATTGSTTESASSGPTPEQQMAAQGLIGRFVTAFDDGDARALAETFAEDAEFVNVYGTRMSGRDGIEEGHAAAFASRLDGSDLVVDAGHVVDVEGTLVIQVDWSLQHSPYAVDETLLVPEGRGVLTLSATCDVDDACLFTSGANVRVEMPPS
ncbi:uncharacterized protein (TIGR02246 family) [Frigoribacterium sp. PvP054]|uniref:SgcJ/EcaC family oxidoreductase n=1 Tax=Frigoribacterium sp. PvP054 TaxID=3156438 RepID=UPI003392D452